MQNAISRVKNFLVSEDGPTAVEYAVMLALIVVACVTVGKNVGTSISGTFRAVRRSLRSPRPRNLPTKGTRMFSPDSKIDRFLTSEDGPTAVEYAVMLALIVVACI